MPFIVPFIPLIAAGASLTAAGVSAYDANNASIDQAAAQAANQKALQQQQQQQANQANLTKQEAVLGAQGQAQEQTGGSLTDSGTASITDLLAGYPGFQGGSGGDSGGGAISGAGVSGGTDPTSAISSTTLNGNSSGAPDITAILAALRNGGGGTGLGFNSGFLSGGNWQQQPPQPQAWQQLATPPL